MKKTLIVVDMQKDFVNGALGTPEAQRIVPTVCDVIKNFKGNIFYTLDQHGDNYLETLEGKKLPIPHCIITSEGYCLVDEVWSKLAGKASPVTKTTFGYLDWYSKIDDDTSEIYICGLCTDICVISNALILRAAFPNMPITVISDACAGTTPSRHEAAITAMNSCQIDIKTLDEIREENNI